MSLEEKIEQIIKALRVLEKWVGEQQAITEDETKMFDALDKRLKALEDK